MRNATFIILLPLMIAFSSLAAAQSLGEIAIGGATLGAGATYLNSAQNKAKERAMKARLKRLGFIKVKKNPNHKNQYFVKEKNGAAYNVTLEPVTGQILSIIPRK